MLNKKIEGLREKHLNCNVFSVYDSCATSIQQLLCEFYTKINECIDISNNTIDLAQWLVNEGLSLEVAKKLDLWLQDGTIKEILNEKIFKELSDKVNVNSQTISTLKSQVEKNKEDIIEINKKIDVGVDILPVKDLNIESSKKSTMEMIKDLNNTCKENNSKNRLRVGSFNILSFRDRNIALTTKASYTILESKLDICGIQEFITSYAFESRWWMKIPGALDEIVFNPLFPSKWGQAGMSILSHHTLQNSVLGKYAPVEGFEPRGYIRTTININNKLINVYNTHLTYNDMSVLRSEMQQLADIVKADTCEYKIIIGDFNTRTESDYRPILNLGYSFSLPLSTGTIDNILYPPNMKCISYGKVVPPNGVSDHDMAWSELELL